MPTGFVKIWRESFDHWLWKKGVMSPFQRWVYMIGWAVWSRKGEQRFYQGHAFDLKRGQLVTTIRQLSRDWKIDRGVCRRFLSLLESATMITRKTHQGCIVVTLLNYDRWQGEEDGTHHPDDEKTPPAHQGRTTDAPPAYPERRRVEGEEGEEQIWPPPDPRDGDAQALTRLALKDCKMAGAEPTWVRDLRAALERQPVEKIRTWLKSNKGKDVLALRDWIRSEDKRPKPQAHISTRPPCPKCKGTGHTATTVTVRGKKHPAQAPCVTCGGSGRLKEQVRK